jgi:hypothetical protein
MRIKEAIKRKLAEERLEREEEKRKLEEAKRRIEEEDSDPVLREQKRKLCEEENKRWAWRNNKRIIGLAVLVLASWIVGFSFYEEGQRLFGVILIVVGGVVIAVMGILHYLEERDAEREEREAVALDFLMMLQEKGASWGDLAKARNAVVKMGGSFPPSVMKALNATIEAMRLREMKDG